jgi:hypothetical protein
MCRFSDAGNDDLATRSGDRRPKSAKARNRGSYARSAVPLAQLWGFERRACRGGNVTGLSLQQADTAGKRLELLLEVVPGLGRLAIIANVGSPGAMLEMGEVTAAARTLGVEVVPVEIRRAEDIAPAAELVEPRAETKASGHPHPLRGSSRYGTASQSAPKR